MAGSPRRFLLSRWPWRALGYLVTSAVAGLGALFALVVTVAAPPAPVLLGIGVARLERRRLRQVDPSPVGNPHRVPPPGPGAWLRLRFSESATWREFAYLVCLASVLPVIDIAAIGVVLSLPLLVLSPLILATGGAAEAGGGLLVIETAGGAWLAAAIAIPATLVGLYGVCAVAAVQAAFARQLLAPREDELNRRVEELARSRARLVNAFEAERRRIERDLHDGAQQHLVLLSMTLGLARLELEGSEGPARELVTTAQRQARQALEAIRELIRNIHPQVLTDLGLAAAVGELAERCPVPVEVDIRLPGRTRPDNGRKALPASQELTAYLVICEAVTNAVKHAGATRVTVAGWISGHQLVIEVTDDGVGGADPSRGTGLRGLADRAAVLDGSVTIASPPGGPTTLRLELPCHFA